LLKDISVLNHKEQRGYKNVFSTKPYIEQNRNPMHRQVDEALIAIYI